MTLCLCDNSTLEDSMEKEQEKSKKEEGADRRRGVTGSQKAQRHEAYSSSLSWLSAVRQKRKLSSFLC